MPPCEAAKPVDCVATTCIENMWGKEVGTDYIDMEIEKIIMNIFNCSYLPIIPNPQKSSKLDMTREEQKCLCDTLKNQCDHSLPPTHL